MIKAGQVVTFKPEFMDPGDEAITFQAVGDEEKGRVLVRALVDLPIQPTQMVAVSMIADA